MADTKSTTPDPEPAAAPAPAPEPTNPAVVPTQQYAAGQGWDVGQTAPSDAYRALGGENYNSPVGPVVYAHPGGHARLIVKAGGLITDGVKRELDAAADESAEG